MSARSLCTQRAAKLLSCILISGASIAHAAWPEKPVRIIVPFAPGGGTDIIGRIVAQQLNEELRQPVVVDNRAGAGSALGAEIVAKSPADGYTLLYFGNSVYLIPLMTNNPPYDSFRAVCSRTATPRPKP